MRADAATPIYDIKRPDSISEAQQRRLLDMMAELNREQKSQHYALDQDLEARIANYELAARMQLEALKVANLDQESAATRKLYGVDHKIAGPFSSCA